MNYKNLNTMKKQIVVLIMWMACATAAQAQGSDAITKFFNKYANDESFTQVTVSSKMFSLFTDMEAEKPEDKEVLDAISKLKGLRILQKDDSLKARALYKEALALVPPKEYEELMSVRDEDNNIKFLIKESGGKISELLMIMGGNKEFMIMSLFGEIDLKQISRIGSKMNVSGLENLEHMNDKKKQ